MHNPAHVDCAQPMHDGAGACNLSRSVLAYRLDVGALAIATTWLCGAKEQASLHVPAQGTGVTGIAAPCATTQHVRAVCTCVQDVAAAEGATVVDAVDMGAHSGIPANVADCSPAMHSPGKLNA